jgi:hypothetical protein
MDEKYALLMIHQLTRLADAVERLARGNEPEEPNYIRPIEEYQGFDWTAISASVVHQDPDGPTHIEWGGVLWTRRSPKNKYEPAIWFSRAAGKDVEGNVKYLRLITFRTIGEADPLPDKAKQALPPGTIRVREIHPATETAPATISEPVTVLEPEYVPVEGGLAAPKPASKATKPAQPLNGSPRPYQPEQLRAKLAERAQRFANAKITEKQRNLVAMLLSKAFAGHDDSDLARHAVQMYLWGVESLKDVSNPAIYVALEDWLKPVKDSGGDYNPDPMAAREIGLVYTAAIKEQGQMELPIEGQEM